jgi:hypothetical protein
MPDRIRVDNGLPWTTASPVPSALELWLCGLGVEVKRIRPAHSQENGVVERGHGVASRWSEWETASNVADLNRRFQAAIGRQREGYPNAAGQTRLQAYPQLQVPRRAYQRESESQQWTLQRVDDWLSQQVYERRVEINGRVTLFSSSYSVGRAYARHTVLIRFDAPTRSWCIHNEQGACLRCHPTKEIHTQTICNLALAKRKRG